MSNDRVSFFHFGFSINVIRRCLLMCLPFCFWISRKIAQFWQTMAQTAHRRTQWCWSEGKEAFISSTRVADWCNKTNEAIQSGIHDYFFFGRKKSILIFNILIYILIICAKKREKKIRYYHHTYVAVCIDFFFLVRLVALFFSFMK